MWRSMAREMRELTVTTVQRRWQRRVMWEEPSAGSAKAKRLVERRGWYS